MDLDEVMPSIIALIIIIAIVVGLSWTFAGFESRAYERATGKKVSQFDAMFLELRVEGC